MNHKPDGWNYIETCFVLLKCKSCNYHFAVERANMGKKINCPTCNHKHSINDISEEVWLTINYY